MIVPGRAHHSLGALGPRRGAPRWLVCLRVAAALSGAALAAQIIWIALASPLLAVSEVRLRGDPRIVEQVAPRIQLPANTNILRAPLDVLRNQAKSVPAVANAYVDRDLPRQLLVVLEPREAFAVVRRADQALLVDREGVVFTMRDEWGWGLPEIAGPNLRRGDPSGAKAKAEIRRLLAVLQALGSEPRLQVAHVELGSDKDIVVVLESGARVHLGGENQLRAKARLLSAAVDQLGADRIEYLDLSDLDSAHWRPERGTLTTTMR